MTIELVLPYFDFGTDAFRRLVKLFRMEIFKEMAKSEHPGLIFTYVWDLSSDWEEEYVNEIVAIFKEQGVEVFYVELEADLEERLKRNKMESRLESKPSKRDVLKSERILLENEENFKMNNLDGEFTRENYLKINNSQLSPEEVAQEICEAFGF